MAHEIDEALLMFLALIGLYSPIAAVSSYIPLLKPYTAKEQFRIALGLFFNVAAIAVVTLLIGEPLLVVLGLTTAALSATGGIALMYEAVPLMLGKHDASSESELAPDTDPERRGSWRSVVFVPFTFPLTIGGATVGLLIGFRANVSGTFGVGALVVAALAYSAVTGFCVYLGGHAQRRLSERARSVLDRVAGILLTAIAATLVASGFTRLVIDVLHSTKIL
jgi:multiple antibiotic resistance protein